MALKRSKEILSELNNKNAGGKLRTSSEIQENIQATKQKAKENLQQKQAVKDNITDFNSDFNKKLTSMPEMQNITQTKPKE